MTRASTERLLNGLWLLVLAIATITGVGASIRSGAGAAHPVAVAVAVRHAHVARWSAPRRLDHDEDSVASPAIDRDSVLVDLGDDDLDDDDLEHRGELRLHVNDHGMLAFDDARLSRRPGSTLRGHPQFDRSRFATGRGLLRGPPPV